MFLGGFMAVCCYGEVLADCFPDGAMPGGAPFNVAFHLQRVDVPVRLLSALGEDELGSEVEKLLIRSRLVELVDKNLLPTGRVDVQLTDTGHKFKINPHAAWTQIPTPYPPVDHFKVVLFGSLALWFPHNKEAFTKWMQKRKTAITVCDLNIRDPFISQEHAAFCLQHAHYAKLSEEELEWVTPDLTNASWLERSLWLCKHYELMGVFLTAGAKGSFFYGPTLQLEEPVQPLKNLVDTVGAGDAFCSRIVWGLHEGWLPERILKEGNAYAAEICGIRGAVPGIAPLRV
jgi:fructokinase